MEDDWVNPDGVVDEGSSYFGNTVSGHRTDMSGSDNSLRTEALPFLKNLGFDFGLNGAKVNGAEHTGFEQLLADLLINDGPLDRSKAYSDNIPGNRILTECHLTKLKNAELLQYELHHTLRETSAPDDTSFHGVRIARGKEFGNYSIHKYVHVRVVKPGTIKLAGTAAQSARLSAPAADST